FPMFSGFRAYLVSALINTIKGIWQPYTASFEGETVQKDFTLICACNGRFYGGGFNPVPEADPQDGILDILLVDKVSRLTVLGLIGAYKKGKYASLPQKIRHIRTNHLHIHSDHPTALNMDGEIRHIQDVDISIAPEKLRFFYPK